ncbi:hypothetical protein QTG54_005171 [Skeletonema marinoi]|uniref:Sulfotransferase domain-containing protein n=1 Tax=Skeletonema marinoi TaxID=267567 RepID=A0AAD8YE57_9STRA|nr:hypothetical protein QTG54_005171 [Skeletonema marinoi]
MALFETISARRRRGHKSSPPAYADDCNSAALTKSSNSDEHEHHKSKSPFIYSLTASYKSILMIGAALMLFTFPLAQKNFRSQSQFYLRPQSQNESSDIQTQLTEAIMTAGESDVADEEKGVAYNVDSAVDEAVAEKEYTAELAARAVEPTVWTCGEKDRQKQTALDPITNQRPFFAFVHVYKTAGSTVRDFFQNYATVCKKSLALVVSCHGSGIEECRLKRSVNAPQSIERVNSTILHDHYDMLGGHYSFGMADDIFSNATATPTYGNGAPQVRHMTFLRQPITRFVSHILYQQKKGGWNMKDTVEDTAEDIKEMIRTSRGKGEYMSSIYKYLLTPQQRAMEYDQTQTQEDVVAHKAQLSIDNLLRYNAIVGMTETFSQSMKIFEHAMGHIVTSTRKEEEVRAMFSRYIGEEVSRNVSKRKGISTGSVLKELNKDEEFMAIFREFVKYEQMIVDFAMAMHQKQYEAVNKVLMDPVLV